MKKFSNYISEKLIINQQVDEKLLINKNFENIDKYKGVEPNEKGICLEVAIPYTEKYDTLAIRLKKYRYIKSDNTVNTGNIESTYYSDESFFKKNKDGVYCFVKSYRQYCWILLFGDDAKWFLNILLNDPEQKIDFSHICKDLLKHKNVYEFECKTYVDNKEIFYKKGDIYDMLYKIK